MASHRILQWLERAPAPARVAAVAPLVRTYCQTELPEDGRDVLDVALTVLLDDSSTEVRRALAEALAVQEFAPRHLVVALAQDLPLVAEPLYRRSPLLIDGELVAAVGACGARIETAIAARPWISYEVADALADGACREAVLAMLANSGADIGEVAFRTLAARFGGDGDVREAMFARPELPLAVRQSLIASLGSRLNLLLVERAWLAPARARNVVREACDRATVELAGDAGEGELAALVAHLRASGQLTTALLVRSMCQGQVRFLEAVLAALSGLPADRVYALLIEGRPTALRALFARAGLPERSHAAFIVALGVWRELDYDGEAADRPRFGLRMIERILTRYQQLLPGEVDDLVAMLRRLAAEAARDRARAFRDDLRAAGWEDDGRQAA